MTMVVMTAAVNDKVADLGGDDTCNGFARFVFESLRAFNAGDWGQTR